jgi:hypothetical protein
VVVERILQLREEKISDKEKQRQRNGRVARGVLATWDDRLQLVDGQAKTQVVDGQAETTKIAKTTGGWDLGEHRKRR